MAWSPLYRIAGASAGLAVLLYGAVLVIVSVTAPAPVSGGAPLLEYIGAHRTLYIVRQVLWLCPSVLLMVVFLALVVALRRRNRSLVAIAGLIGVTSWALSLAWPTTGDGSLALVMLSDGYATAGKAPFVAGSEVLIALNDVPTVIGVFSELLRPVLGWAYAIYGVLLFAWLAWIAVALLRLGRPAPR
ncbi:hypothetical protein [Nonomuraea sp. NPDC048826]|uniref:hypothetical protein n=1 Tax=Nonomuraea sp. NPDC048826 TaxID=3364347 RepID=UPI0037231CB4